MVTNKYLDILRQAASFHGTEITVFHNHCTYIICEKIEPATLNLFDYIQRNYGSTDNKKSCFACSSTFISRTLPRFDQIELLSLTDRHPHAKIRCPESCSCYSLGYNLKPRLANTGSTESVGKRFSCIYITFTVYLQLIGE